MILQEIAQSTRKRVNKEKSIKSLDDIKKEALALPKGSFEFEEAVKKTGMSFICEVKKASPSKGVIAQDFPYVEIAKDYEKAGI